MGIGAPGVPGADMLLPHSGHRASARPATALPIAGSVPLLTCEHCHARTLTYERRRIRRYWMAMRQYLGTPSHLCHMAVRCARSPSAMAWPCSVSSRSAARPVMRACRCSSARAAREAASILAWYSEAAPGRPLAR